MGGGPEPLDELTCAETTLAVLQHVLRDLDSADLTKQTPCSEFDVAQLADHLIRSLNIIGGAAGAELPTRDTDTPLEAQVADAALRVLEAWRRQGVEGTVDLNGRQVPATMPVVVLSLEFLVHAWDFAMVTGREVVVSEPVSEYVLGIAGKAITPDARGYAGFDKPVATDPDARVLDRLIAFTGRQPAVSEVSR